MQQRFIHTSPLAQTNRSEALMTDGMHSPNDLAFAVLQLSYTPNSTSSEVPSMAAEPAMTP
jgi:hypothetical protein